MIVQRYPSWLWPVLRGHAPLLLTGPRFDDCIAGRGIAPFERLGRDFVEPFRALQLRLEGLDGSTAKRMLAELLLETGVVAAYWVTHVPEQNDLPPRELMRIEALEQFVREIPDDYHATLTDNVLELLDGMSSPEHYRSLFNQYDAVTLSSDK